MLYPILGWKMKKTKQMIQVVILFPEALLGWPSSKSFMNVILRIKKTSETFKISLKS